METINDVGNTRYIPTVLSFCAGYAGIERGLDLAGVEHRVLAYVEIEAFAIANLVSKMESGELDPAPVYTDLKTFPAGLFRDAVDLITGGYPCQPFSAAGKRAGADDPRHLWPFIDHHIGIIDPGRVFFENVEGHISLGLSTVISDLEERGYDTTWGIFSAAEVGAPHQRKRVYIMADSPRNGFGQWGGERNLHQTDGGPLGSRGAITTGASEQTENMADSQRAGLEGHTGAGADRSEPGRVGTETDRPVGAGSVRGPDHDLADAGGAGQQVSLQQYGDGESQGGDREAGRVGDSSAPAGGIPASWEPEPGVGRVVDGGPDRVDRIRLLGNGVVPQCAAKAWQVLDEELANDQH
jgi:DNA (cytosine-5)-methyltransferase 1